MGKKETYKPGTKMQATIDAEILKAIKAKFGKPMAVEATLGVRYSDDKNGQPFMRFILENHHTVFVAGWHKPDGLSVTVSDAKIDPKSYSGKQYFAKLARQEAKVAKREKKAAARKAVQS
jgi:hypothetical protein